MSRSPLQITTPDGTCPATLHTPPGVGPWPGVLFFVDAAGTRETMARMADHLAGLGYAVLLPDLFYRLGAWQPFDVATAFTDPTERARLTATVAHLDAAALASDTGAFLDALLGRPEVAGATVGTTGYCMGGRASLIAAGHHPDRIAAAASFHGGRLAAPDDPDAPVLLADRIAATLYVAAAENDASFPPEQATALDTALTAAGVRFTMETYPAAHGFAVDDNPTFDAAAQERHWAALQRLYGATLG